jgi:hypothetical protein
MTITVPMLDGLQFALWAIIFLLIFVAVKWLIGVIM